MKYTYFLFFLVVVLASCYKDSQTMVEEQIVEYPEIIVQDAVVLGSIYDEDGHSLVVSKTRFNEQELATTVPYFYYEAESINKVFEVLTLTHPLGFDMYYPLVNIENSHNRYSIYLPTEFESFSYNEGSQADIQVSENISLKINENAVIDEQGTNPADIDIISKEINPRIEEEFRLIPGEGRGLGLTLNPILLEFSEVFYLGFNKSNAKDFHIDRNKIEINSSKELYLLDNEKGYWRKLTETENISAGFYGTASQIAANLVRLDVSNPFHVSNLEAKIFLGEGPISIQDLTSKSQLFTFLPLNESIRAEIHVQDEIISEKELSVLTSSFILETNLKPELIKSVVYSARDCEDELTVDNIMIISDNTESYIRENNNNLPISIFTKSDDNIQFQMINNKLEEQTELLILAIDEQIIAGRQYFCGTISSNYLILEVEGEKRLFSDLSYEWQGEKLLIEAIDQSSNAKFVLKLSEGKKGNYPDQDVNVLLEDPELEGGYNLNCLESSQGCGFDKFNVSNYSTTSGEFIKASFNGEFWIESLANKDVGYRMMNGELQIKL